MIDYIPPDIPPAVVKYADEHIDRPNDAIRRWFKYLTHFDNKEIYVTNWSYNEPRVTGHPIALIYDCHDVHRITKQEYKDMQYTFLYPKYLTQYAREEHLCHRNLRAFNRHTKPADYKKRVKHITPKYIPQKVVAYIDEKWEDSNFPGTTKRYIKYLTTWNNKYEVYSVYWAEPFNKRRSNSKMVFYDCNTVRRPNLKERSEISTSVKDEYSTSGRPYLCTSD